MGVGVGVSADVVASGYAVVVVAGGVLIVAAMSERFSASRTSTRTARRIEQAVSRALPWQTIAGLVVFYLINPLS